MGHIEGVQIVPLRRIADERGTVSHMMRATDPHFIQFGEIYFSSIYPGVVKGWHLHKDMTLNYAVVVGQIKLVMFDDRENSATTGELMEVFLGRDNYVLVTVPPLVWNGFKGTGTTESIVANCCTHVHDPRRTTRLDPYTNHIPYDWNLRNH